MKKLNFIILLLVSFAIHAQYKYEPTPANPYGSLNPEAPPQTADFSPLIGLCKCKSVTRVDQSTWADTVMMDWTFKYIMNGMGVQDETLKEDGGYSGSIRQYNADSARWYVHYYSTGFVSPTLSSWEGNKTENSDIVLYRPQQAPNGMEGFYRLTFSNISEKGFAWAGEWVNPDETIVYPTWRIYCVKKE